MNKRKFLFIFPILFVILLLPFLFSSAFANTFKTGLLSFFDYVNNSIVLQIKEGVCENFISSFNDISQWPSGSLRTEVAIKSCEDVELAKIKKLYKSEISSSSSLNYNLSTASSTIFRNNFLNSIAVEIVNKIYPKTIFNTPIISVQSSSTKISGTTTVLATTSVGAPSSSLVVLTNNERQKLGLKILTENQTLDKIAKERLEDMFSQGYFEHISPQGTSVSDLAKSDGYGYLLIGENIALGNFKSSQELVDAWMASPGHRENILNPSFSEIGVYTKEDLYNGADMVMGVQIFGNPTSSCPYPDASLKVKIESEILQANNLTSTGKIYLAEIQTMESTTLTNSTAYNTKVSEYNVLVKEIDALYVDIKSITDTYNAQVKIYNSCISSTN